MAGLAAYCQKRSALLISTPGSSKTSEAHVDVCRMALTLYQTRKRRSEPQAQVNTVDKKDRNYNDNEQEEQTKPNEGGKETAGINQIEPGYVAASQGVLGAVFMTKISKTFIPCK